MPLENQVLSVALRGGVDSRTDPKAVIAGKLIALENGSMTKPGAIRKRNGFSRVLSRNVVGSATPIAAGEACATFKDELLLADGTSLHSYDQSLDAWVNKGSFVSAYVTQRPVVRNTYAQSAQDSATHSSGLSVVAWEDSSGGVRYSAIDTATGVTIVNDALVDASGTSPKVLAIGGLCLILWVNGTNLYYAPIAVATPQTLGTAVLLTNNLSGSAYDAEYIGTRIIVAWATSTGWSAIHISTTLAVSARISVASTVPTSFAVFADSLSYNAVIGWSDGISVRAQVRSNDLATTVMGTTVIQMTSPVVSMTGAAVPGASSSLRFFYTLSNADATKYQTLTATLTTYTTVATSAYLRSVSLAGKAFVYGARIFVPVVHASPLQATYFVADSAGLIVAKILSGISGGIPARAVLPEVNAISTSQFQIAALAKYRMSTEGGSIFMLAGVNSITLDFFDAAYSYARAELGEGLIIGGGCPYLYDGAGVVEHGFHLYPEGVAVANLDSDTGTAQTYGYAVVYAWTDNQGQVHRSASSVPVAHQKLSVIDGSHRTTVTIPTLRITAKTSSRRRVICEVYRTIANGTIYYLASSASAPTYNDTTADTVTFTDSVTDATLIGNPQLYTNGEVDDIAPGPVSSLCIHQNRVIALDSENPLSLWWSKPVVPGTPVRFSDLLKQNIDAVGGDITAIARMDAWLVIFKRTAIFVDSADGPPASGTGTFGSGQQVPTNVGCVNPRSVNLNQNGITFQSDKGWHLLDRSLQVRNIPDVDAWRAEVPTSALTMPNTFESRFTLASGIAIVNDDAVDQWGTFTDLAAVDAVIWQGLHTYLRSDGQVRQETPGVFNDAGAPIKLRIKTSWLQFAGVSGFQRVRQFVVLGDYVSPHSLVASIAYDFNSEPTQVSTIDASTLDQPAYGEDSVYGGAVAPTDSLVYGGTFPGYAWRINLTQQKCAAIQVTLEDSQPAAGTPGEGCSFGGLAFRAGVKAGLRKLPAIAGPAAPTSSPPAAGSVTSGGNSSGGRGPV